MRKIAVILCVLCCFFVNTAYAASMLLEYDGGIHNYTGAVYELKINGKTINDLPLEPIIFNDRALVPVREVFEELGATVNYYDTDKVIKISYGSKAVKLQIGSSMATVDGIKRSIPDGVAPKLIAKWGEDAKTMVPVRFISENVGLNVEFDSKNGIISISEKSVRPSANPTAAPAPTATPDTFSSVLNKLKYEENDGVVTVTVSASGEIDSISKPATTSAGVLYVDVYGAKYTTANTTAVNLGSVKAVRFGLHDECTRIAIDTSGMKKYSASLASDKKSVVFKISGDASAAAGTSTPSATPSASPTASASPAPTSSPTAKPIVYSEKMTVVLDAGHGGSDPGAISYLMNDEEMEKYYAALESTEPILATMEHGSGEKYNEKDIALSVTKKVKAKLEAKGINVIMTRTGDTYPTLDERPALANEKGAVIFVSIHLNSTTSAVTAAKGIEVYYSEQNNDNELGITSKELAKKILNAAVDAAGAKSRGVKSGNLLVNRKCLMPSALVELGFMNNPEELELLTSESYQNKLATGIANGIISAHNAITIPKK